jgi:hypothetical protein
MFNRIYFIPAFFVLITASCATPTTKVDQYVLTIDEYSAGEVEYEGAYNNFRFRTTLMNTVVQQAYIDKKTEIYKWDPVKRQAMLQKMQEPNSSQTSIFMSFFTPIRQDDNLSTAKSIWSIYLQTSQGRYEGKAVKNRDNRTELYLMFPYHQRFSSGYDITFNVPLSQVENEETTLTVSGPLGTKTVKFPAKKY